MILLELLRNEYLSCFMVFSYGFWVILNHFWYRHQTSGHYFQPFSGHIWNKVNAAMHCCETGEDFRGKEEPRRSLQSHLGWKKRRSAQEITLEPPGLNDSAKPRRANLEPPGQNGLQAQTFKAAHPDLFLKNIWKISFKINNLLVLPTAAQTDTVLKVEESLQTKINLFNC